MILRVKFNQGPYCRQPPVGFHLVLDTDWGSLLQLSSHGNPRNLLGTQKLGSCSKYPQWEVFPFLPFLFFFKLSGIYTLVWSSKLIIFSSLDHNRRYGNTISKDKLTWAPYNTVLIISGTRGSPRLEISAPIQRWNMDSFLRSSNLYHVEKVERKVGGSHIIWKPILETSSLHPHPVCSSTTKASMRREGYWWKWKKIK